MSCSRFTILFYPAFILVLALCAGPGAAEVPDPQPPPAASPSPAASALTVDEAVTLAWTRHPRRQAWQARLAEAQAKARIARAWPPLVATVTAVRGTTTESDQRVAQEVELAGQPGLRGRAAEAESRGIAAAVLAEMMDVAEAVRETAAGLRWAATRLEIVGQALAAAVRVAEMTDRRHRLGEVAGNHVLRAQIELARIRAAMQDARREVAARLAAMNELMGRQPDEPLALSDGQEPEAAALDGPALLAAGLARRPELAAAAFTVEAAEARLRLARRLWAPQLELSAYEDRLDAPTERGAAARLVVPLWSWGRNDQEAVTAASAVAAARADAETARLRVAREIETSRLGLQAARDAAAQLLDGGLSRAEQLLAKAEKGYAAGALSFLDLLDAQRTLRDFRMELADFQLRAALAEASLLRATATDLEMAESVLHEGGVAP